MHRLFNIVWLPAEVLNTFEKMEYNYCICISRSLGKFLVKIHNSLAQQKKKIPAINILKKLIISF